MADYLPVLLFILAAISFGVFNLVLSWVVRPAQYDPVKMAPYECGIETLDEPRGSFLSRTRPSSGPSHAGQRPPGPR